MAGFRDDPDWEWWVRGKKWCFVGGCGGCGELPCWHCCRRTAERCTEHAGVHQACPHCCDCCPAARHFCEGDCGCRTCSWFWQDVDGKYRLKCCGDTICKCDGDGNYDDDSGEDEGPCGCDGGCGLCCTPGNRCRNCNQCCDCCDIWDCKGHCTQTRRCTLCERFAFDGGVGGWSSDDCGSGDSSSGTGGSDADDSGDSDSDGGSTGGGSDSGSDGGSDGSGPGGGGSLGGSASSDSGGGASYDVPGPPQGRPRKRRRLLGPTTARRTRQRR